MSAELDTRFQVVSPTTGEVLSPDSPTEDLGQFLSDVRDFEGRTKEAKREVTLELLARMDRSASWTVRAPGLKLTAPSPKPSEAFDALPLREALLVLVDEGVLSIEAVDAAVEQVIDYKVKVAGVNKLRKIGGRVAEAINAHRTEYDKDRYISVSRA